MNNVTLETQEDGWPPALRLGAFAALLPLLLGLIVFLGWMLGSGGAGGVIVALIIDAGWLLWWRSTRGAMFPQDIPARTLSMLAVAVVVLAGLAYLAGRG